MPADTSGSFTAVATLWSWWKQVARRRSCSACRNCGCVYFFMAMLCFVRQASWACYLLWCWLETNPEERLAGVGLNELSFVPYVILYRFIYSLREFPHLKTPIGTQNLLLGPKSPPTASARNLQHLNPAREVRGLGCYAAVPLQPKHNHVTMYSQTVI